MNIKTFSIHTVRNTLAFVIALGLGYTAYLVNPGSVEIPKAQASGQNISGFAWSDTVGYISFNNSSDGSTYSYGVNVDPSGNFTGQAWSQGGVGWISFDRSVTGNPPYPPYDTTSGAIAKVDTATGNVTGWARALAGCDNVPADPAATPCVTAGSGPGNASGGWDGWIKLSGTWTNGVKINLADGKFSGYAWGGAQVDASGNSIPGGVSLIGWVKFAADGSSIDGCSGITNDYSGTDKCKYGVMGPALVSSCPNGANNPPSCNQCPDGNFYNTVISQCYPCGGTGCTGSCLITDLPASCLICNNGTSNPPSCDSCPPTQKLSGGICVTAIGDGTCGPGETLVNSPTDCKPKTSWWQF